MFLYVDLRSGNKEHAMEVCEQVIQILKPSLFNVVVFDEDGSL